MMRAFIVSASPLVRAGLQNILATQGVEVVGAVSSVELLADHLVEGGADIVLVNASGEQFETVVGSIDQLELSSEAAFVLLADHPAPGWPAEALRAGIGAILPTGASPEQLVAAMQAATAGLVVIRNADLLQGLAHGTARYADDLAELVAKLDLKNAVHIGHSTGCGEVARYIGRHGTKRVAKAVLISAIPPLMLKTPANPGGLPMEVFDGIRKNVLADRYQFWRDLSLPFYGYNKPGAKISEGLRESFWLQSSMAGFPAAYLGIKAWSETDLTEDLKKFDVPTLILHGDGDQVVPIADSAILSAKLVKNAILKIYPGLPHGMCQTHKDPVNADLLEFIGKAQKSSQAA